jgi:Kae1-associated kinase Bud32
MSKKINLTKEEIISRGAEAILIKNQDILIKKRIPKSYRIQDLDTKLRKLRTRHESKIMSKIQNQINTPKIIDSDESTYEIKMNFISGKKLSDFLDKFEKHKQKQIITKLGKEIAKLHILNIIHSDLTTSNMILKDNDIFLIDFGLSFHSIRFEDKAVDIHLFKQALESKHYKNSKILFNYFLKGYQIQHNKEKKQGDYEKTLNQLKKVELRGRYKH